VKRFLIPLLAFISLPISVNAEIDEDTAKFCLKATDFAGCIETMTKDKLPSFQKKSSEEGLRTWTRDSGVIVRMRTSDIKAVNLKRSGYGRYLSWIYFRSGDDATGGWNNKVTVDCKDYTAKWKGLFGGGWSDLNNLEKYREKIGAPWKYNSRKEVKIVMDEFCPQMDRLVSEAKERDRINGIKEAENRSSSGGIKINCDSPVWKKKPRCN